MKEQESKTDHRKVIRECKMMVQSSSKISDTVLGSLKDLKVKMSDKNQILGELQDKVNTLSQPSTRGSITIKDEDLTLVRGISGTALRNQQKADERISKLDRKIEAISQMNQSRAESQGKLNSSFHTNNTITTNTSYHTMPREVLSKRASS